jgi:hypothetical protein
MQVEQEPSKDPITIKFQNNENTKLKPTIGAHYIISQA